MKTLLTIEMIPKSAWGNNVRTSVPPSVWDTLRHAQYRKADLHCEICGAGGRLECHEIWEYSEEGHVQKLIGLIALCPSCHSVKHFGRTCTFGAEAKMNAIQHLMEVNDWTAEQVQSHIEESLRVWQERSKHVWKLDISFIA